MLYREVNKKIQDWIRDKSIKQALLIMGARQVGKTYSIRNSLKEQNCKYFEINFATNPELCSLVDNAHGVEDLLRNLKLLIGNKKVDYIFFDEAQKCIEILTMIKFLVEEGSYRYILSGSLLGIEMNNLRSAPVGYINSLTMYPLSLEEFFIALDTPDEIMELIRSKQPLSNFVHNNLMKRFYLYLVIGGMPAVVQKYLDTKDVVQARNEQNEIKKLYKIDYTKYEKNSKLRLIDFYEAIPSQLQAQNRRFMLNSIKGIENYKKAADSCTWLKSAGVVLPVYNVTDLTTPLVINEKRNLFKLFLNDIGLLVSNFTDRDALEILSNPQSKYLGPVFENFAAQQLKFNGYKLRYYNNKKVGEIDFIVEHNSKVVPIEIKSGKTVKKHKALTNALQNTNYDIDKAFVFCTSNFEDIGNIHYCPIYSLMCFKEDTVLSYIYDIGSSFQ